MAQVAAPPNAVLPPEEQHWAVWPPPTYLPAFSLFRTEIQRNAESTWQLLTDLTNFAPQVGVTGPLLTRRNFSRDARTNQIKTSHSNIITPYTKPPPSEDTVDTLKFGSRHAPFGTDRPGRLAPVADQPGP